MLCKLLNTGRKSGSIMSYYYLYLIKFEDDRFYIGSRKSKVPAKKDVKYWGSPGKINQHLWEMKKEKYILLKALTFHCKT